MKQMHVVCFENYDENYWVQYRWYDDLEKAIAEAKTQLTRNKDLGCMVFSVAGNITKVSI